MNPLKEFFGRIISRILSVFVKEPAKGLLPVRCYRHIGHKVTASSRAYDPTPPRGG